MMGFVITLVIVVAIVIAGMWIFEDDDNHDEWRKF